MTLVPPIRAKAPTDVRDVIPLPGYRLAVRFMDGTAGTVDLSARVASPKAGHSVWDRKDLADEWHRLRFTEEGEP
jgi:hypothetical protein